MPNNNSGYDFICANNKKIDVKSACITRTSYNIPHWIFSIQKNKIADYFLLLAFDNREKLEPILQWLIPSEELNKLSTASITPSTINKWHKFRQPIGITKICCNTMRGI